MKAMILAAGLGQRMRPLTDQLPKPLLSVAGKPLLQYHLERIRTAGITEVVINLAYLGDKIREFGGDGSRFGLEIFYSQEPEPLETAGAILQALPLLGSEPFMLINGDVWCDLDLEKFRQRSFTADQMGHLLLVPNPPFHPTGDFALDKSRQLIPDPEKTHPQRFTFGGISMLRPQLVDHYPLKRTKFPLVEVLRDAIDKGQLTGEVYAGQWSDVGTPERLQELDKLLRQND